MAINTTDMYIRHHADHDMRQLADLDALNIHQIHMTRTVEESKAINNVVSPCIIISASGMITGGRVLHHLARRLPDSRSSVLLVGYQAEGSGGSILLSGAKYLRIHGEEVPVRAEVVEIGELSAHAGRSELVRWLAGFKTPPRQTFLVHGEPSGLNGLRDAIAQQYHWPVTIPTYQQSIDLNIYSRETSLPIIPWLRVRWASVLRGARRRPAASLPVCRT